MVTSLPRTIAFLDNVCRLRKLLSYLVSYVIVLSKLGLFVESPQYFVLLQFACHDEQ